MRQDKARPGNVPDVGLRTAYKDQAKQAADSATKQDQWSQTVKSGSNKDIADNASAISSWKNLANYWGAGDASGTSGYNDVYTKVGSTNDKVTNLNTAAGQKQALADTYGKSGNYGSGFNALDAFIVQGDQAGQSVLQNFQDNTKSLGSTWDTAKADVNQYIQGADARGQEAYTNLLKSIGERQSALDETVRNRGYDEYDKQLASANNTIADAYAKAGVELPKDINDYLKVNSSYDPYTFTSDAELAAINALAGLDDDSSTNARKRGSSNAIDVDFNALMADLAKSPKAGVSATTPEVVVPALGAGGGGATDRILQDMLEKIGKR